MNHTHTSRHAPTLSHSIQPPRSFISNYAASSLDTRVAAPAQGERLTVPINEIADELRLPPNTIRRRIQTATNRLREHLLDAGDGDPMKITKTRILLVESDGDTVDLIRLYLGPAGYHMTAASAYAESLNLARTWRSNLYLLGDACEYGAVFDLCRQIRVFDSDTPIIFCTAFAYPADRERGMSAGAQAYLTKPYDLDELVQTIKQLIAKAPAKGRRQKRGLSMRANEGARNGFVAQ